MPVLFPARLLIAGAIACLLFLLLCLLFLFWGSIEFEEWLKSLFKSGSDECQTSEAE